MGTVAEFPESLRADFELDVSLSAWHLQVKASSVALTVDTDTVYTFDLEGRPWSAFVDGVHYRRGLNGRVRARPTPHVGGERHWLSPAAAASLWHGVRSQLLTVDEAWRNRRVRRHATAPSRGDDDESVRRWLSRLLTWDSERQDADAQAFRSLYTSVPILPPDLYNALVVQVTRGCAWNRCTFCSLYHDRSFATLTADDLDEHLARVRRYFGAGLLARRHLFLGDANLLAVPPARLHGHLERVCAAFPEPRFRQLCGFADVLGPRRHREADLRSLVELGLRRLYFGFESGSAAVRSLLGKAGDRAEAVAAVRHLRGCGIGVGVIVLLGAGGEGLAADHEAETEAALTAMRLGAQDIVFFSPLRAAGDYDRFVRDAGLGRLDAAAMDRQRQRIETALVPAAAGGPRRATYDIDDFIY